MGIAVKKWFICYKVPFIYYVGTCRVGGSRVGQLFDISSTKTSQLVTVRRDEVVWEGITIYRGVCPTLKSLPALHTANYHKYY